MLDAVSFAHKEMLPVIGLIEEFTGECGKDRWEVTEQDHSALANDIKSGC